MITRKNKRSFIGLLICLILIFMGGKHLFAESGVTDSEVVLGQSCALTGPTKALGLELKTGAEAYFNKINDAGGVNGRKIKLISYDDGYEPEECIVNTRKLIDEDKAFILFGYVGTPTTKAIIPIVDEAGIPLVGPFTGAGFLRDPDRKVFNIRGTYDQETGGLVESLHRDLREPPMICLGK